MKLLFITERIDEKDDDLAFVTQWIDEFIKNGFRVEVICLKKGEFDDRFPVHSLGKELKKSRFSQLLQFFKLIFSLKYNRVFVHLSPNYFTIAGWYWLLRRIPTFLWFTHYASSIHLSLAAFYSKYMFAATKQSLPQYNNSPKKIVTGHGVDVAYWRNKNQCTSPTNMVMVHRLSRSKRVELGILSLLHLSLEYNLTIYGRDIDSNYFQELKDLVTEHGLTDRVVFKGPLPMPELRTVYPKYRIMINMASETIDKTMLEAMCNGVFPVTTSGNSKAIGLHVSPDHETPESIAHFIKSGAYKKKTCDDLVGIVEERHSLDSLIKKMSTYIKGE